jgi:enoyl-[acyl-carrier-protein] reductase (NADH)
MAGKTAVVMGVANDKSIAWGSPASSRRRARR